MHFGAPSIPAANDCAGCGEPARTGPAELQRSRVCQPFPREQEGPAGDRVLTKTLSPCRRAPPTGPVWDDGRQYNQVLGVGRSGVSSVQALQVHMPARAAPGTSVTAKIQNHI